MPTIPAVKSSNLRNRRWCMLALVCCISYYNSLSNSFAFDDHLAIVNNGDIKDSTAWNSIWYHDIWGKDLAAVDSHRSYRPLLILMFKLLSLTLGLDAWKFRVTSIFFHFITTTLMYQNVLLISSNDIIAFASSLLFASHPIHVESVSAVVNMAEALSAIFYLLAFIQIMRHRSSEYIPISLWICFVTLSILFKETGVTVAGVMFTRICIELIALPPQSSPHSQMIRKCVGYIILAFATVGAYILFRLILANTHTTDMLRACLRLDFTFFFSHFSKSYLGDSQLIRKAESPFSFLVGAERIYSLMYLHFRYMYVMVWPEQQCAEYAFDCIPSVTSWRDPRFAYSLLMYAAILLTAIIGLTQILVTKRAPRSAVVAVAGTGAPPPAAAAPAGAAKSLRPRSRIQPTDMPFWSVDCMSTLTSLTWLVVPFIPMSGVLLRLGTLLAERLLYIPSIGYCMLLASGIHSFAFGLYYIVCFIFGDRGSDPPANDQSDGDQAQAHDHAQNMNQDHHQRSGNEEETNANEDVTSTQAIDKRSSDIRKFSTRVCKVVYWVIILGIVALYARRTHVYNRAWKDDETLFFSSLKVCPRSSKLNLQVAKIYLNRGDYAEAEEHVRTAKEIDPTFCDIGYQEALLKVFYEKDYDGAMETAALNLKCIFTSMQSLELLTKLWEQDLLGRQNNYHILEKHGNVALMGGIASMAVKKYQAASVAAFEAKDYNKAIALSVKAEKAIPAAISDGGLQEWHSRRATSVSSPLESRRDISYYLRWDLQGRLGNPVAESMALRELACYVDMLAGTIRLHLKSLAKQKGSPSFKPSKSVGRELLRTKALLFRAAQPECVIVDFNRRVIVSNHAAMAMNHLSSMLVGSFKKHMEAVNHNSSQMNTTIVEEYANFAETSTRILTIMYTYSEPAAQQNSITGSLIAPEENAIDFYKRTAIDMALTAIEIWDLAGRLNFKRGNYSSAVLSFDKAMKWGVRQSDGVLGAPCHSLYWKAHAVAATDGFLSNASAIAEAVKMLTEVEKCTDGNTGTSHEVMLRRASSEKQQLEQFLNITKE